MLHTKTASPSITKFNYTELCSVLYIYLHYATQVTPGKSAKDFFPLKKKGVKQTVPWPMFFFLLETNLNDNC